MCVKFSTIIIYFCTDSTVPTIKSLDWFQSCFLSISLFHWESYWLDHSLPVLPFDVFKVLPFDVFKVYSIYHIDWNVPSNIKCSFIALNTGFCSNVRSTNVSYIRQILCYFPLQQSLSFLSTAYDQDTLTLHLTLKKWYCIKNPFFFFYNWALLCNRKWGKSRALWKHLEQSIYSLWEHPAFALPQKAQQKKKTMKELPEVKGNLRIWKHGSQQSGWR